MDTWMTIQATATDWLSGWLSTMSGWLSLVFAVVIVLAVVALVRDWMQDRGEFGFAERYRREPPDRRITRGRH